jgi:hypothetical protein
LALNSFCGALGAWMRIQTKLGAGDLKIFYGKNFQIYCNGFKTHWKNESWVRLTHRRFTSSPFDLRRHIRKQKSICLCRYSFSKKFVTLNKIINTGMRGSP